MSGSNTINLGQLSNMANQVNDNQLYDDTFVFDPTDMDIDDTVYDPKFDLELDEFLPEQPQGNAFLGEPIAPAPLAFNERVFAPADSQDVVPIAQAVSPSPAALTPNQAFPIPPPGWAYHPAVGWHIPVAAPANMPLPNAPLFPQAPLPEIPHFNAPLAAKTGKKSPVSQGSSRNKRKYGPSVYLEEQSKKRAAGDLSGPRPVSRESVDFHYQGRSTRFSTLNTVEQAPKLQRKKASPVVEAAGNMKELNMATVEQCRCPAAKSAKANKISRPRNAFIIFRNDYSAQFRTPKGEKRGNANTYISKTAAQLWNSSSQSVKDKYKARAEAEKKEHKELYPEYHYDPMGGIKTKFGNSSCTCGAYKLNMAELQRLREGGRTPPNAGINIGASDSEEDRISSRTRSQSRTDIFQAPVAPMVPPYSFGQDNIDFGINVETQDAPSNIDWDDFQGFNPIQHETNQEPPTKKRRSSRKGNKVVHYADGQDEDEDVEMYAATPRKHRPAPISTSRKSSSISPFTTAFDASGVEGDNVASRTRSKSISMADSESSPNSLFGDDDGDEIVVDGSSRASPKGVKLALPPTTTGRATRSQHRKR